MIIETGKNKNIFIKKVKKCATIVSVLIAISIIFISCNRAVSFNDESQKSSNISLATSEESSIIEQQTDGIFLNLVQSTPNLKVMAVEYKESKGQEYLEPENGNIFLGIKFKIENTSKSVQPISSMTLFSSKVDDKKIDCSISAMAAFGEGSIDGEVAPGQTIEGYFAVEAPKNWKKFDVIFSEAVENNVEISFTVNK